MGYEYLKFLHILIVIIFLGTSAGLGVFLEFYGDHPDHGLFVLRATQRIVAFFVLPGYALVLATGMWMAHISWLATTPWIVAALGLWGVGIAVLAFDLAVLRRQIRLFASEGPASAAYRRVSLLGRGLGAGFGLVVIVILYLMVFKPSA